MRMSIVLVVASSLRIQAVNGMGRNGTLTNAGRNTIPTYDR